MATLVLTAVGGAIAGPIGAAIGSMAGQAIDRQVLFKPKGREGPRLTELALQTSSYGTPIAKVFGTMRIGGSVIWATDLIEHRATSGNGKGQPKTTNYSYSASFAVALSGRPILRVGRIWAEGKLLRGAAGDFKSATGFRLHTGGDEQTVDSLIAAAEGGLAPAHRGLAYAVFEDFQLADYGNRIPSLTFEVIADEGAVTAGAIAGEISDGLVDGSAADTALAGFAAYGDVPAVLEMLAAANGAWFAPAGARLRMRTALAADRAIGDDGVAAGSAAGQRNVRSIAALESVPRGVTLSHYDPARDFQTGLQRAVRPGKGRREARIELPAAISADTAKTLAEGIVARGEAGRERRKVTLGWRDLGVAPGDVVTIADVPGLFRVATASFEHHVVRLDCVRLAAATAPASASSGRVLPAPDAVAGTTIVHAFELPPLDDSLPSAPRITIAAAGSTAGWRQAALLYSLDDGARWIAAGATGLPATLGVLASEPAARPATLIDRVTQIEVELAHDGMALAGADMMAMMAGANLALVGDELLQFGAATQIGARRWRLSTLLRGRRGTEAAIGGQSVGDRFVLIEPVSSVSIDLPLSAVGATMRVIASGIGDVAGPAASTVGVHGVSVVPPSPVHLAARALPGGDAALRWTRRSRGGWRWIDGVDAPLGEEREAYHVTIAPTGAAARTVEVVTPDIIVAAADRLHGPATVSVRQIGSSGESAPTAIELPGL